MMIDRQEPGNTERTAAALIATAVRPAVWVLVAGVVLVLVSWIMFMVFADKRPGWLIELYPGMTWEVILATWFGWIALFKLVLYCWAGLTLFAFLWARQLSGRAG